MQIYGDGTLNDISCHKKGESSRRWGKFVIYSKQTNLQPLTLYANSLRFHLIKPCRFPIKSMFTFNIRLANRIPPFSPKTTIVERQYLGLCELFLPPLHTNTVLFVSFFNFPHNRARDKDNANTWKLCGNYSTAVTPGKRKSWNGGLPNSVAINKETFQHIKHNKS